MSETSESVTSMLVTDVGDQMVGWQVWDVGNRFRMLITDEIHWENHLWVLLNHYMRITVLLWSYCMKHHNRSLNDANTSKLNWNNFRTFKRNSFLRSEEFRNKLAYDTRTNDFRHVCGKSKFFWYEMKIEHLFHSNLTSSQHLFDIFISKYIIKLEYIYMYWYE